MRKLRTYLLFAMLMVASAGFASELQTKIECQVREYYAEFLDGNVESWELEFRRVNLPRQDGFEIASVRGEKAGISPEVRGCAGWMEYWEPRENHFQ